MPKMIAAFTLILLLGMVITRVQWLKRGGVKAMHFGKLDKTDFLIPPLALFYFYTIFAAAFGWPGTSKQEFFHSEGIAWIGVLFCLAGLSLLFWSLVSFGRSFRVGIDIDQPDQLVTAGIFALNRIEAAIRLVLQFHEAFNRHIDISSTTMAHSSNH